MRVVKELIRPECKITVFHWNNRYLIKLEQGYLEQTFKIDQFDIADERDLDKVLDRSFMESALSRFADMALSLRAALQRA